ncbi:hypothetical protein [Pedobacter sp. GR22-6]|uniref:hypothetical protein n=1 Tax=Pedobacter sp. GR22-6 TaxID=3127957 RepID=UPI00307D51AA
MRSTDLDKYIKSRFYLPNIRQVYFGLKNKSSKGIDKIGEDVFEKQKEIQFKIIKTKVLNGTYKFSPYLEKLKLKGQKKYPRVISIPTIRD